MLGLISKRKRDRQKKRRASFKVRGEVGFFDRGDRDFKLSQLGDPLEKLNAHVDWEIFRADLAKIYAKECKNAAGRKPCEAALDGIYILRTGVGCEHLAPGRRALLQAALKRKSVEQALRSLKSVELQIRPIYHFRESRVRAHLFLCMLAYYVQWHLDCAWAELLFKDATPLGLTVDKTQASPEAQSKASAQRTADGQPVHSFATLIDTLALRARNTMRITGAPATFTQDTQPNLYRPAPWSSFDGFLSARPRRCSYQPSTPK